jgi:hypothetical protein
MTPQWVKLIPVQTRQTFRWDNRVPQTTTSKSFKTAFPTATEPRRNKGYAIFSEIVTVDGRVVHSDPKVSIVLGPAVCLALSVSP